jgi:hypothetical protein
MSCRQASGKRRHGGARGDQPATIMTRSGCGNGQRALNGFKIRIRRLRATKLGSWSGGIPAKI